MDTTLPAPRSIGATLISLWGMFGVVLLIGSAVWRLAPLAIEPIADGSMTPLHWGLMIGWSVFNAYAEGYRGFQLRFSPRTAARALYLGHHPTPLRVALAPLFCMGFFGATRRVLIAAWAVLIIVAGLVALVRALDQPWRGIVDAGVVIGLGWGLVSLVVFYVAGLTGNSLPADPQVPGGEPAEGDDGGR